MSFWDRKFGVDINKYWKIPYTCTKETRLHVLQYKLFHNIYPTNILLNKMNIKPNNKCSNCVSEVDYLEHFFYLCPKVFEFWKEVKNDILIKIGVNIKLNVQTVLFGVIDSQVSKAKLEKINHILLIAKMCISKIKKTDSRESIFDLFQREKLLRKIHT